MMIVQSMKESSLEMTMMMIVQSIGYWWNHGNKWGDKHLPESVTLLQEHAAILNQTIDWKRMIDLLIVAHTGTNGETDYSPGTCDDDNKQRQMETKHVSRDSLCPLLDIRRQMGRQI